MTEIKGLTSKITRPATTPEPKFLRHIVANFFYTSEALAGILLLVSLGSLNGGTQMQSVNPTFPGIRHPTLRNAQSFCLRCHSTIYWNAVGNPRIMQFGNENLKYCLQEGCSLVFHRFDTAFQRDTIFASLTPAHC